MRRALHRPLRSAAVGAVLAVALALGGVGPAGCTVEVSDELRDALDQLRDVDAGGASDDTAPPPDTSADGASPGGDTAACPDGAPCDDGDPCTVGDRCAGGLCVGAFATDCDDGDPCTEDACAPDRGCVHALRDDPACRPPQPCPDGCDDGNPCTLDGCDETVGVCEHRPLAGCRVCDPDGDWQRTCDDADPGTTDGCAFDEALGGTVCTHVPRPCGLDPAVCDDGDPCTRDVLGSDCLCTHEPIDCDETE